MERNTSPTHPGMTAAVPAQDPMIKSVASTLNGAGFPSAMVGCFDLLDAAEVSAIQREMEALNAGAEPELEAEAG